MSNWKMWRMSGGLITEHKSQITRAQLFHFYVSRSNVVSEIDPRWVGERMEELLAVNQDVDTRRR